MQHFRRFLSFLLVFSLLLTLFGSVQPVKADHLSLDEYYQQHPNSRDYNPMTEGYYGYLSVKSFPISSDHAQVQSLPVLVKDGHVLVEARSFADALNMDASGGNSGHVTFSVFEKEVTFHKNTDEVRFRQGKINHVYSVGIQTVFQEGYTWIPLPQACLLLGIDLLAEGDEFLILGTPRPDVLDVAAAVCSLDPVNLRDLYSMSASVSSKLELSSQAVDNMDGILHFELDKLLDATSFMNPYLLIADEINGRVTDRTYAQDITRVILSRSEQEVSLLNNQDYFFLSTIMEMLEDYANVTDMSADAVLTLLQQMAESGKAFSGKISPEALAGWFGKVGKGSEIVSSTLETVNAGFTTFAASVKLYDLLSALDQQETLAREGLELLLASSYGSRISNNTRKGMQLVVDAYGSEEEEALVPSLYELMLNEEASTITQVLATAAMGPAAAFFSAYGLAYVLPFGWSDTLEQAESYQKYLVASTIASEAQRVLAGRLSTLYAGMGLNPINTRVMEDTVRLLYIYLKANYVAGSLGISAMAEQAGSSSYLEMKSQLTEEARLMSILLDYSEESFLDPMEITRILEDGMPDDYLECYVTPNYVHFSITVVDAETGEIIPDADLSLKFDLYSELKFKSENGAVDFYLPIRWKDNLTSSLHPNPGSELDSLLISCEHPDYPEAKILESKNYVLTDLAGTHPVREVQMNLEVALGELDYWRFVHDTLVPEYGIMPSDLDYVSNANLDPRSGIVGAEVRDMNKDGVDELLVIHVNQNEYGNLRTCIDLYTKENGAIVLVGSYDMQDHSHIGDDFWASFVELDDQLYLYFIETQGGDSVVRVFYDLYAYTEEGFVRPLRFGFTAGAGSSTDTFHCEKVNFNGVTSSEKSKLLIYNGNALRAEITRLLTAACQDNGLPEHGTFTIVNQGVREIVYNLPISWMQPGFQEICKYNRGNGHVSVEDHSPLLEEMSAFPDYDPANPRKGK